MGVRTTTYSRGGVTPELGESLVGSYLRYVEGCELVAYNAHTPGTQGEIDVIAVKQGRPPLLRLCEVITHVDGANYGGYHQTAARVRHKVERAQVYARSTFPDARHRHEVWSPVVPRGLVKLFTELEQELIGGGLELSFVINGDYADCIQRLIDQAHRSASATNEPAFRLLQILARVRGELRI